MMYIKEVSESPKLTKTSPCKAQWHFQQKARLFLARGRNPGQADKKICNLRALNCNSMATEDIHEMLTKRRVESCGKKH